MKIAIVNDTRMMVEVLRRIVTSVPEYQVAWVAQNGSEAVSKCSDQQPDLVLMDLTMPEMNGVEATRQIMERFPCAILIVTASIHKNTTQVFEAMGYGALDVVKTPVLGTVGKPEVAQEILKKIAMIANLLGKSTQRMIQKSNLRTQQLFPRFSTQIPPLTVIGASTGGPKVLGKILSQLPKTFQGAIILVQHIDSKFASGLADWLNQQTPLTVELIKPGSQPQSGKVLLASTNDHLILRSNLTFNYVKEPRTYPYRPSIDVFFNSVAQYGYPSGVAVLLTGMGRDGALGLQSLRRKNWYTIAQERKSCVVYGMPKAAVELNAAQAILSPDAIASTLIKLQSNFL